MDFLNQIVAKYLWRGSSLYSSLGSYQSTLALYLPATLTLISSQTVVTDSRGL